MQVNEQNYVDEAERVIKALIKKSDKDRGGKPIIVTTSKLRNLLGISADIYNEMMGQNEDKLSENICSRIEYLRVRFLYEAGRCEDGKRYLVKDLVNESGIIEMLKEVKGSRDKYILFFRYMEALVAFRKFHVEKDD